jgi:UDP-N-acetylmuramate--alanine ligase
MHIYFSGIGGAGIGPLAMVAKQAGYDISGSDKQDSQYIDYLRKQGVDKITIGQSRESLQAVHEANPVDWVVYTSALTLENPDAPELAYATEMGIRVSKRDELLNQILQEKGQKLIAVAGTHGKTTTTAMVVWLFTQLGLPVSYILPAKTGFADMGHFDPSSEYFVYECDEFDRNFLAFEPHLSLITGVTWDHHEIFPTRDDYKQAFLDFIGQSQHTLAWQDEAEYLGLDASETLSVLRWDDNNQEVKLHGKTNRLDAWLAMEAVRRASGAPAEDVLKFMNLFPGLQRRMELIKPNLYSDYAHTPEKIRGAMSVALEMAADKEQPLVIVYEPLTNRRQHFMMDDYTDCFEGAAHIYWVPSYLAREDPNQRVIPPAELISHLSNPEIAEPAELNDDLKTLIENEIRTGAMVVCMSGGGGGSLDEWLRKEFAA